MQLLMFYSRPTAVGPANEEIHFNSSGEVKVKFHPPSKKEPTLDELLAAIARDTLHIDTLETRKSDSLDFHDVAVWSVKAALEAA